MTRVSATSASATVVLLVGVVAVAVGGDGVVDCGEMLPAIALSTFAAGAAPAAAAPACWG